MYFVFLFGLFSLSGGIQVTPDPVSQDEVGYHDNNQLNAFMWSLAENYSHMATLYSIGESTEGRNLWVLKIRTGNSPIIGTPHVKFIGNIHGNEPVGRELILLFAEYLLKNYHPENEVGWILDRTIIHLLPSLNPDGFERSKEGVCYSGPGRENGNFVDLNRSFPDPFKTNKIPIQPEALAITHWMSQITFVLSASFHGGALVANYPYDSNPVNEKELLAPQSSLTPDDDVFKHLAQTYSNNHLTMHKGRTCNQNQPSFAGGITNGAAWYSFTGGMQDFNYVKRGCMELTLEISCCKYPLASHLPRLWEENRKAMLELIKQAQMGVRGIVVDKITSAYISGAVLRISDRSIPFSTSKNGEFWRILLPGTYLLHVEAEGYQPQSFPFTVVDYNSTHPTPTWLNIFMDPVNEKLELASSNMTNMVENSANIHSLTLFVSFCLPIFFSLFTRQGLS